jgi:hypothetical protein
LNELINTEKLYDRTFINLKDLREVTHLSANTLHRWSSEQEGKLTKIKYRNKCFWKTEQVIQLLSSMKVLIQEPINTYDIDIQMEDLI